MDDATGGPPAEADRSGTAPADGTASDRPDGAAPAFPDVEAVVLDVDGTLVRGTDPVEGAPEAVRALRAAGIDLLAVTNNPTRSPAGYAEKLGAAGIDFAPGRVLTSGTVTARHLRAEHPDASVYVVGEPGLVAVLEDRGVSVTEDPGAATVVVGSIDREFTYDRLARAMTALEGAAFVATDPDPVVPAGDGPVPGSGAIVEALAAVAGRRPTVAGKPAAPARRAVFDRLDVPPERCLVVGDRPGTDLALGARAGAATALVTTGVSTRADLDGATVAPTLVADSLPALARTIGASI